MSQINNKEEWKSLIAEAEKEVELSRKKKLSQKIIEKKNINSQSSPLENKANIEEWEQGVAEKELKRKTTTQSQSKQDPTNTLFNCPDCGKKISRLAKSCPFCGAPDPFSLAYARSGKMFGIQLSPKWNKILTYAAFVFILAISISFLYSLTTIGKDNRKTPSHSLLSDETTVEDKGLSKPSACDKEASLKVQAMLREMATWKKENGMITFNWGSDWDQASSQQRLGLIQAFANSDACLAGSARKIKYYREGKLVGEASPTNGIKLLDK